MEMGLAQGSRVAETAMRAVKQANAQVCFANLETARKEIALGVARQRYKRLEADMFRSRIELADTLSEVEKDHQKHEIEMKRAEERAKELEVLRQLTADAKRKRRDAEDRETSLRAKLDASERRAEASERDSKHQRFFTWATVARETERAAGRERYRMAAFLQRYVVENEYLRRSRANAEESASDLLERLRHTEGKLVKALAAPPALLRGPVALSTNNSRQAALAAGMNKGAVGRGGAGGVGGPGGGSATDDSLAKPSPPSVVTQAELAIRRLNGRAGGARDGCFGSSSGGGADGDGSNGDDGGRRGGGGSRGRSCGRCRSQRAAAASAQGELRYTRGLVAELSFLLTATEGERDSLASLLVLAERRMDQLVVTQEELALSLAWKSVSVMEEQQHLRLKPGDQPVEQQRLQLRQGSEGRVEHSGEGHRVATTTNSAFVSRPEKGFTATQQQGHEDPHLNEDSALLENEQRVSSDTSSPIYRTGSVSAADAMVTAATTSFATTAFEPNRSALETLELRRRVRELEVLQKAAEAELREVEAENRRLKGRCRAPGSPPAWMSWGDGGGVVGSTADEEERRPLRQGFSGETVITTSTAIDARRPRRDGSGEIMETRPGGHHGRRGGREGRGDDGNNGASGLKDRGLGQENRARPDNDSPVTASADCALSLPMLSAADIGSGGNVGGDGGCEFTSGRTGTAGAGTGAGPRRGSCLDVDKPQNWDWGDGTDAARRPEGRCRSRSSPFLPHARGKQGECTSNRDRPQPWRQRQHRCFSRGQPDETGIRGGGTLGECDDDDDDDDDDGSLLIKGKLAWVLGLPAETTSENELLAEVMHLVVERGNASTDADALEAQLRKMDDQALSVSRLVASTAGTSQAGERNGSRGRDCPSVSSAALGSVRRGDGRVQDGSGSGSGLGFVNIGVGYSSDATFLSSLSHVDGGNVTEEATESRHGPSPTVPSTAGTTAKRQKHTRGAAATSSRDERRNPTHEKAVEAEAAGAAVASAAAATARPTKPILSRGGGRGATTQAAGGHGGATMAAENGPSGEPGRSSTAAAEARPAAGNPLLEDPGGGSGGGGGRKESLDDGTTRTSFSKTLQGRVVSIDVFCTKALSELERQQTERSATELQMDEIEYEIRVEAYDPTLLRHHVLHILDEHIKRCLSDHPHLYTQGAHRTRVHQSLVDRLIFMSEDDVRTERNQQGRGVTGGADSGSDSGSGDDGRTGKDVPSSAPTPPGSGGGAASMGVGSRGERKQLLVLIGDAGEIIAAEKPPGEDNADAEAGGIEKEEEIVEGVVYQYNPPVQEDVDPEQAKIARDLLMVESESSSQEGDDGEEDEDSTEYELTDEDDDEEENAKDVEEGHQHGGDDIEGEEEDEDEDEDEEEDEGYEVT
eukprot:g13740.t1